MALVFLKYKNEWFELTLSEFKTYLESYSTIKRFSGDPSNFGRLRLGGLQAQVAKVTDDLYLPINYGDRVFIKVENWFLHDVKEIYDTICISLRNEQRSNLVANRDLPDLIRERIGDMPLSTFCAKYSLEIEHIRKVLKRVQKPSPHLLEVLKLECVVYYRKKE